ncbi:MAG: SLBB domain-containing protein [Parachlamydiaceae bacterium]|nr:SLBB domain-containing protein [Parachlamydiaceae bacterium]
MPQKLPFHEWLIVSLIILTMLSLTVITYVSDHNQLPPVKQAHSIVQDLKISIEGAVLNPGNYTLKKGSSIGDLLQLAEPTSDADLRKVKKISKLKNGQKLVINTIPLLTIHVEGAVKQEGSIVIPDGTMLKDLASYVSFLPEADIKKLLKKRRLKDGETIRVDRIKSPKVTINQDN